MSSNRRSDYSSPFDDMLAESRRQFDALMPGGGVSATPEPVAPPTPEAAPSNSIRLLNQRYGEDWRHEVVERRREGDEAVVLGRLTLTATGVVKSQFGRAPLGGAIAGRAGDIAFRSGGADGGDEAAAWRAAEAAALDKCVALI